MVILLGLQIFGSNLSTGTQSIGFQDFKRDYLDKGIVDEVVIVNKSEAEVFVKEAPSTDKKSPFANRNREMCIRDSCCNWVMIVLCIAMTR